MRMRVRDGNRQTGSRASRHGLKAGAMGQNLSGRGNGSEPIRQGQWVRTYQAGAMGQNLSGAVWPWKESKRLV